jgi:uncharacterized membrane-anchored protein YhcB (DUF1043 family)
MAEDIGAEYIWVWVGVGFTVAFLCGLFIGRLFSTGVKRIKALRVEIDETRADLAKARSDLEETRVVLEETRQEASEYRHNVTEHFSKAADLFNSLTVNYRAVYEHLAKSSLVLCDENTVMLSEGVPGERRLGQEQDAPRATPATAPKLIPIPTAPEPKVLHPTARAVSRPDPPPEGGSR